MCTEDQSSGRRPNFNIILQREVACDLSHKPAKNKYLSEKCIDFGVRPAYDVIGLGLVANITL